MVPGGRSPRASPSGCSPRTRGWSPAGHHSASGSYLLPAHAGMVPSPAPSGALRTAAPRARGDGPEGAGPDGQGIDCSPRTRGWSPRRRVTGPGCGLLPAHAGMVPPCRTTRGPPTTAPRARGDGPGTPYPRAKDAVCSPRTRGWSRPHGRHPHPDPLLPAHAGMAPRHSRFMPHPGPAPRARGDGPVPTAVSSASSSCSPRTRGWSRRDEQQPGVTGLLPAHAGMVPSGSSSSRGPRPAPRARGDGPQAGAGATLTYGCSPRTRGWSRGEPVSDVNPMLLPAHAGMVPVRP